MDAIPDSTVRGGDAVAGGSSPHSAARPRRSTGHRLKEGGGNGRHAGGAPPAARAADWPAAAWASTGHKRLPAQAVVYREGDEVYHVYRIHRGMVKLVSYLPNGRARIVRLHGPGDSIGLEALLGGPYEHTAIAAAPVELECLPARELDQLHCRRPEDVAPLLRQWHDHLNQADRWIADFSTGEIKPRVARLVRFLAELEHGRPATRVALLRIHEMADILGVTQESVSRILAIFKRDEILKRQEGEGARCVYRVDGERLAEEACR